MSYTSEEIKAFTEEHVDNIFNSAQRLSGVVNNEPDIEYNNPEVGAQQMLDNLKDINTRLLLAIKDVTRLESLTEERREQLARSKELADEQSDADSTSDEDGE